MTDLRTAAQQALEFIRWSQYVPCQSEAFPEPPSTAPQVEAALRAALAEHFCDTHCTWADHAPGCVRADPVQEPVAWKDKTYESLHHQDFGNSIPLYTAPPQRKPLSAVDLRALYDQHAACQEEGPETSGWWDFARAIERAHGIT